MNFPPKHKMISVILHKEREEHKVKKLEHKNIPPASSTCESGAEISKIG